MRSRNLERSAVRAETGIAHPELQVGWAPEGSFVHLATKDGVVFTAACECWTIIPDWCFRPFAAVRGHGFLSIAAPRSGHSN